MRLLLHICCAPDAAFPWECLTEQGFETTGYFYGNNIAPHEEYMRRRSALEILLSHVKGHCSFPEYHFERWREQTGHLAQEPEGGKRCALCFAVQLRSAAEEALHEGFGILCTTLTISPHKDVELINHLGRAHAEALGLQWLARVWRKNDGYLRSVRISRALGLYRQNYCGCPYSMRTPAVCSSAP
jgi:predicted adenine nucleotide alpha hydrolase (AANH) superfamily ATPase